MDAKLPAFSRSVAHATLALATLGVVGNIAWIVFALVDIRKNRGVSSYIRNVFFDVMTGVDVIVLAIEGCRGLAHFRDEPSLDSFLYDDDIWRCRIGSFGDQVLRIVSSWLAVAMVTETSLYSSGQLTRSCHTRRQLHVTLLVIFVATSGALPFLVFPSCNDKQDYHIFLFVYKEIVLKPFVIVLAPLTVIVASLCWACFQRIAHGKHVTAISGSYADQQVQPVTEDKQNIMTSSARVYRKKHRYSIYQGDRLY